MEFGPARKKPAFSKGQVDLISGSQRRWRATCANIRAAAAVVDF